MALTWNDLFLNGSVLSLSTSQWGARLKIRPADLGIEDTAEVAKALSLGHQKLAPHEAFEKIHDVMAKAKRAVDSHSLTFGFIYGARYVPEANLGKLSEKLRELRTEFVTAVDEFLAGYDAMKESMLPVIEKALQDACKTPESAAEAMNRVRQEYPSAEDVRRKFALYWSVYAIQGPKQANGAEAALAGETETVKSLIGDMIGQLRTEVTEKLAGVLTMLNKGGKLSEGSVKAAYAVLDRVQSVNIMGDTVLEQQVKAIRTVLGAVDVGKRVPDSVIAGLETIRTELDCSVEEAVAAAEKKLTGGRRKLQTNAPTASA